MDLENENSCYIDLLKGEYYVINTDKRIFNTITNKTFMKVYGLYSPYYR